MTQTADTGSYTKGLSVHAHLLHSKFRILFVDPKSFHSKDAETLFGNPNNAIDRFSWKPKVSRVDKISKSMNNVLNDAIRRHKKANC